MSDEHKQKRLEVYWTTISYRTLILYGALVLGGILAFLYLVFPDWFSAQFRKLAAALEPKPGAVQPVSAQARFINFDGKVEVRKADSTRWVPADYRMTLDRGDLVQTGPDGVAKIVFADTTTYTVKPDTLITVEENFMGQDRTTRVGVSITTGAVDLATGKWDTPGSQAELSFADARARMQENSRAAVRTDPTKNQHEITVAAGGAELQKGDQRISLLQWERASFERGGPITKTSVLAPPEPQEPVNLQPVFVDDLRRANVSFRWKAVTGAVSYHMKISRTSMFTQLVGERRVNAPEVTLSGLEGGEYFWAVTALDSQGKSSEPSDTYRFTLTAQGRGQQMLLEIEGTQLHGNVVEVIGRTEPGAAVLINGQSVANIAPDGRFRHFTDRLPRGTHKLTIIGQNRRGGFAKKEMSIQVP